MSAHVRFTTKRTQCPKCGSSDGFAGIVSIDGAACGNPSQHGKCHACGEMIWPDDAPNVEPVPSPRAQRKPSNAVRDGIIAETSAQTSNLHRVLIHIGGEGMAAHLRQWNVGTDHDGRTLFHYVDARGRHVTTKGIAYDAAGKRMRDSGARFGVSLPSQYVPMTSGEGHRPCLFGEQWMQDGQSMIDYRDMLNPKRITFDDRTPVALVESEKSAIVASFIMPSMVWIAAGGSNGITADKAEALRGRTVLILFDCDDAGRNSAAECAKRITAAGGVAIHEIDGVPVQDVVFTSAAPAGFDIADHVMHMLATRAAEHQIGSTLHISQGVA
ncbi:MAG: toprim domain-containing protein [Burkholderiaceae bacterium]|nr:toprim domain-containing protein [Burkholderiaceae bacterium]